MPKKKKPATRNPTKKKILASTSPVRDEVSRQAALPVEMPKNPKGGNSWKYSEEVAETIFHLMGQGLSLAQICSHEDLPSFRTVQRWAFGSEGSIPGFKERYIEAQEARAMQMADEIIAIADDSEGDMYLDEEGKPCWNYEHIKRVELRIKARQWLASRMNSRYLGDKVKQEHTGEGGGPVLLAAVNAPPEMTREEWVASVEEEMKAIEGAGD